MIRRLALATVLLCTASLRTAAIEVVLSPPGSPDWRVLEFPKIPRHTTYTVVRDGGFDAFKADADCSASTRYLALKQIDLRATPRLHWRWKIEQTLQIADERVKRGDDFAARVSVMFQFDADHASLLERARHSLGTRLYGEILPGNAIDYVWSSREPAGARWDNPYTSGSKMVSLGTGELPQWTEESVDVAADFVGWFGYTPPPILAIAVMTDSDNACQHAIAYYADFRFTGR